jgi:hypothetical protein
MRRDLSNIPQIGLEGLWSLQRMLKMGMEEGGGRSCGGASALGHWQLNILEICGSYVGSYLLEFIGEFLYQSF